MVSFATKVPGHIVPVAVGHGAEYMVHRHGFLCATPRSPSASASSNRSAQASLAATAFFYRRVSGQGTAWLELSGELIVKNLAPGEVLRVHPGHVGAFQSSVGFQITTVPGIKNMIFGGDGIFLAVLMGPGTVWLQTLPISRLAHQINEYLPHGENRPRPAAQFGRNRRLHPRWKPVIRIQHCTGAGAPSLTQLYESRVGLKPPGELALRKSN